MSVEQVFVGDDKCFPSKVEKTKTKKRVGSIFIQCTILASGSDSLRISRFVKAVTEFYRLFLGGGGETKDAPRAYMTIAYCAFDVLLPDLSSQYII